MCNSISHCREGQEGGGGRQAVGEEEGEEEEEEVVVLLGKLANDSNERSVLVF